MSVASSTRYKLDYQVGKGADAHVYQLKTQEGRLAPFVAKVASSKVCNRVEAESRLLGKVQGCKYVPKIVEGEVEGVEAPYYIMPWYSRALNSCGKLPIDMATYYLRQALVGLREIHGAKVVHKDLTLENLLLDEENNLIMIDFGSGESLDESEVCKRYVGHPDYAPREILERMPHSYEVDLGYLGVSFFKLVSGRFPERAGVPSLRRSEILPSSSGDERFEDYQALVSQLLIQDPKKRIKALFGGNEVSHDELLGSLVERPLFRGYDKPYSEIFKDPNLEEANDINFC